MRDWILRSNRAFDRLDWWKLLILIVFIIGTNFADNHLFEGTPVIFGSVFSIFIIWRMLAFHFARTEKQKS